jgi:hypothetical protein
MQAMRRVLMTSKRNFGADHFDENADKKTRPGYPAAFFLEASADGEALP